MAAVPPICDFGWQAPDFNLPATDGKTYALADIAGPNGVLIMFICNHCPYVKAILDRIVRDAAALQDLGIGVAAICANDPADYPSDGFDNMARVASANGFSFPYLHDETQATARTYGAACTPDFFGFNADRQLQYRGRLDASGHNPAPQGARRELVKAMELIAETGFGPRDQVASMGCSIKWRRR